MDNIEQFEGDFTANNGRYAIVVARFNGFVVESLVAGAVDALKRHGVSESDIQVYRVPGAFEIPLVASRMASSGQISAHGSRRPSTAKPTTMRIGLPG